MVGFFMVIKHQLFFRFLTAMLLVGFLFCCGHFWSIALNNGDSNADAVKHCLGFSGLGQDRYFDQNQEMAALILNWRQLLLLFGFWLLFGSVTIRPKKITFFLWKYNSNFSRGWLYLIDLFKKGIIHPKIFIKH